ncbi:MAG: arginase family protein [Myxococcota bacterium]
MPGVTGHAFLRHDPDTIFELTPETFTFLEGFATPRAVASIEEGTRAFVEQLVELGILIPDDAQVPAAVWEAPLHPLFRVPVHPIEMPGAGHPVTVLGAAWDGSTLPRYPRGTAGGPASIRASALELPLRRSTHEGASGFFDVERRRRVLEGIRLTDGGNLIGVPGCDTDAYREALTARIVGLAEARHVLLLGGDHSVSLAGVRGALRAHGPVGILHFDAHTDRGPCVAGQPIHHANVMSALLEDADVQRLVQVGLRGFQSVPEQDGRYRVVPACEASVEAVQAATEGLERWYISVDIDVLDPAVAPHTPVPEPDGLDLRTLRRMIQSTVDTRHVVGADLVEVRGGHDEAAGRTARVAALLCADLVETLGSVA